MGIELWTALVAVPGHVSKSAVGAEDAGWRGVTITDSQNLAGDPYVAMSVAAAATSTLRVATGVTNPFTRHAAVAASALWHIHIESKGRAELGVGRGDSAMAHLGLAPASVAVFEDYLLRLQRYLRSESVEIDWPEPCSLAIANLPTESRLHWLALGTGLEKPAVFVVASGPRVLQVAASHADRVVLAVGADPERVRWAIRVARSVRDDVKIGAYVNVVVDDDRTRARALVAAGVASFARFSAMHGRSWGPMTDEQREVIESIPPRYDLNRHFRSALHAQGLPSEFVDRFAVVGTPSHVEHRIRELAELGIDRFFIVGPTGDIEQDAARAARRRFVEEVLPALST